jgi:hypothetical protein
MVSAITAVLVLLLLLLGALPSLLVLLLLRQGVLLNPLGIHLAAGTASSSIRC